MLVPILEPLLSDMNMAAKGMDRVSITGRAMLLERAANILDTLNSTDASEIGTFPSHLRALAANVEEHPAGSLAAAMMDAVDVLKTLLVLLDAKYEVILEDADRRGGHRLPELDSHLGAFGGSAF